MTHPSIGHDLRAGNLADHGDRDGHCRTDHRGECLSEIAALTSLVIGGVARSIQLFANDAPPAEFPSAATRYGFFQLPKLFSAPFSDDAAPLPLNRSHAQRSLILVIDDDPGVTKTFAHMLALEGYDVRTALDAETGLREAEISHPDAVLLDLRMPLVDGLAFLRRLRAREDRRQTPVAIVTGDYFVDDLVSNDLRGLGAELYFKPLWLEDLVRITHTLVDGAPPLP